MSSATATNIGTIALADQLNHLRARVPLGIDDVAAATGADDDTVHRWIERNAVPLGDQANHLAELIAVVEELALNIKAESIPAWFRSEVPALGGGVPAEVIAAGGYERVMDLAVGLSAGVFT